MQVTGIALGLCVAVLWGLADPIATLAVRSMTTFRTTLVSQGIGLLLFVVTMLLSLVFGLFVFSADFLHSAPIGLLAGLFTAFGYFALYRALETGPLAIASPLSSASAVVTLALSMSILGEQVGVSRGLALAAVLIGVVLASTQPKDLVQLLKKRTGKLLLSKSVLWAYSSVIGFGGMDFLIGAGSVSYGWFAPVFWTRFSSVGILVGVYFINKLRLRWSRAAALQKAVRTPTEGSAHLRSASAYGEKVHFASVYGMEVQSKAANGPARQFRRFNEMHSSVPPGNRLMHYSGDAKRKSLFQRIAELRTPLLLTALAALLESAAMVTFSITARIMQPGVTAAIACNYSLVAVVFGLIVFRERLATNQMVGIFLVMCGLTLLAIPFSS
jgi:uncharacterized membrane protein